MSQHGNFEKVYGSNYGAAQCTPGFLLNPVCTPAAPPSEPELRAIQSGIEAAVNRVGNAVVRVDQIGDYVFGPSAGVAGGSGAAPSPSGIVHSLKDSVSTLHTLLNLLEEKIERLNRL